MYLEFKGIAGDSIETCAVELTRLAKLLSVPTQMKFNDVTIVAYSEGSHEKLIQAYKNEIRSDSKYKFASNL